MSSTLSFLDQFNAPSTEGGKRLSIYTPKHTHVGDSTLLTLLLSNPTDIFNKLKAHNPEATNATDRAALEAYLSARHEYDEAVKAADEAIDHHKRLLRQQDDRVLTELIRLDNLKVAHRFQPLLPRSIRAQHNKFIPRAIPNAYLPLPAPLPTSAFKRPPIPSPFLQATPRSTTIPADWQPNPGRNARKEWFDEEEDDGVDWELYGDGEHLHNGVRAHFVPGIVLLRFFLH
ncbi:predicted protein [Postia placenta Mad-698-R]|nr:predicted protein [Postia placenta Mad-698-R]